MKILNSYRYVGYNLWVGSMGLCNKQKKFFYYNHPANICLFKVNNKGTRNRCEVCLHLTVKAPEQCHRRCLVSSLLTLMYFKTFSSASIVDIEEVNVYWVSTLFNDLIEDFLRLSKSFFSSFPLWNYFKRFIEIHKTFQIC